MSTKTKTAATLGVVDTESNALPWVRKPGRVPIMSWAVPLEGSALEQATNLSNLPFAIDHVALGRLEDAALVRRTREGNQVYFEARPNQPMFGQIRDIVRQVAGAPIMLRRHLIGMAGIERAVIFGSYAQGSLKSDSDVDLLIIGNPDRDELTDRLEMASLEISRPVNEVVMTQQEFDRRRARGDRLVESIESQPTVEVLPPPWL